MKNKENFSKLYADLCQWLESFCGNYNSDQEINITVSLLEYLLLKEDISLSNFSDRMPKAEALKALKEMLLQRKEKERGSKKMKTNIQDGNSFSLGTESKGNLVFFIKNNDELNYLSSLIT